MKGGVIIMLQLSSYVIDMLRRLYKDNSNRDEIISDIGLKLYDNVAKIATKANIDLIILSGNNLGEMNLIALTDKKDFDVRIRLNKKIDLQIPEVTRRVQKSFTVDLFFEEDKQ